MNIKRDNTKRVILVAPFLCSTNVCSTNFLFRTKFKKSVPVSSRVLLTLFFTLSVASFGAGCVPLFQPRQSTEDINSTESGSKATPPQQAVRVQGHSSQIVEIAPFIVDGMFSGQVLSAERDGQIIRWDVQKNTAYSIYRSPKRPKAIAFSHDARLAALAGDQTIKIVSLETRSVIHELDTVRSRVGAIRFYPDDESVLLGCVDGKVYRWKFVDNPERTQVGRDRNKTVERYLGHQTVVSSLESHPEGRVFFSGDWNGVLQAWLPYDQDVYSGEYDTNIFEWRYFSDEAIRQVGRTPPNDNLIGMRIDHLRSSPDGYRLVVAREGGLLEVWKVRGFEEWVSTKAHRGLIRALDISPNGKSIVTYGRDEKIKIWEVLSSYDEFADEEKGELVLRRTFALSKAKRIVFADDDTLLVGLDNGTILEVELNKLQNVEPENSDTL